MRFLERGSYVGVATAAVRGNFAGAGHRCGNRLVHTVAREAVDIVPGMAALRAIAASSLVAVAGNARGEILTNDVFDFERLSVHRPGAMARFAGFAFEFLVEF